MGADQPDALLHQMIDLRQSIPLDDRMSAAAIHVEHDCVGVVEGGRIGRPAVVIDDRQHLRRIGVEAFFQQLGAGVEFMLAAAVAGRARDHHHFLAIAQLEPLEPNVFEFDVHRLADVKLQREDAAANMRSRRRSSVTSHMTWPLIFSTAW